MTFDRQEWMNDAACRGMDSELFFPGRGEATADVKAICGACPVRVECQDYAIGTEQFGIWGGLSERERKRIRTRLWRERRTA